MRNSVNYEHIQNIIRKSRKWTQHRIFDKQCIIVLELPNGFTVVGESACVDPDNYDDRIAEQIAMKNIENRLWELEGYLLQNKLHEE